MAGDDEPFEIELQRVEREVPVIAGIVEDEVFEVAFHCQRPGCWLEVQVTFGAEGIPTLEVVSRAMAEMHRAFHALAEQSAGWGGAKG